jgi:hypothetical protein
VNERVIVVKYQISNFSAISWREQVTFNDCFSLFCVNISTFHFFLIIGLRGEISAFGFYPYSSNAWRSYLRVEETTVPGENHPHAANYGKILSNTPLSWTEFELKTLIV